MALLQDPQGLDTGTPVLLQLRLPQLQLMITATGVDSAVLEEVA